MCVQWTAQGRKQAVGQPTKELLLKGLTIEKGFFLRKILYHPFGPRKKSKPHIVSFLIYSFQHKLSMLYQLI